MWASLTVGLMARPWARRMAGAALVALTIALFILNLRRQGERTGRAAVLLETLERNDAIQRQMLDAASRRPRSRDDLLDRLRETKRHPAEKACSHGLVRQFWGITAGCLGRVAKSRLRSRQV